MESEFVLDETLLALYRSGVLAPAELVYVGPPLPAPAHEWIVDSLPE